MKTKSLIILSLSTVFIMGCKKEGCTNPSAINYDADAKKDNGTCVNQNGGSATTLECDYFHQARTLVDNPEAPIDYIITCEAKVKADLTIEPGVVIAFEQDAGLYIEEGTSKITMNGTEDKPIILTGTQKTKGYWAGVLLISSNPSNSMQYVTIEYAGSKSMQWGEVGGFCGFIDAQMTMQSCTFAHCESSGLFWDSSNNPDITNSTFTGNDVPVKAAGINRLSMFNASNDYTGNVNDYVYLEYSGVDANNQSITWRNIGVPYYLTTRIYNRWDVDNAQLTIEAGTEIIFVTAETHMRILDNASITAVGTSTNPIVFRGLNDVQAAWNTIIVSSGSTLNEIGFVAVKNAGNSMSDIGAAIQVDYESYLNLHDANFTTNAGYAVGMLYTGGMADPVLDHTNITVDNGQKFCYGRNGTDLTDPNDPNS